MSFLTKDEWIEHSSFLISSLSSILFNYSTRSPFFSLSQLAKRRALHARFSALFIALTFENYERYFFFMKFWF